MYGYMNQPLPSHSKTSPKNKRIIIYNRWSIQALFCRKCPQNHAAHRLKLNFVAYRMWQKTSLIMAIKRRVRGSPTR
ncbi:hypothetical protein Acife_2420 [Acidithiobacillus ferrivorans SS3]|uniref:Uncharacterized protein n=1 Tax=Acidithiobacillus ferrivorans SS3 TaxID=743299 RepID=G0JPH3_9PROT|nr:hypothetical protein Acife_2420 [Acidithiobacillus ferrivorans SS3]